MGDTADTITLSEDGFSMPTVEVLTGRGFITGKSGSGKSNTTSVVAEELLDAGVPLLIVDTDGEYFGLKEQYDLLHVGGDEHCDKMVTPSHAQSIAEVALERQVPVILDISGFREQDEAHELVGEVVEQLFVLEKTARTPFLLVVEEAHEFMPEQGGLDDLGETLIRVAKRGRKRGLGVCALSQRPAAVTKDYITQCDWLVWHRLTWENDTQVVGRILGSDYAEDVQELDTGEAIVMTDWDDSIQTVMFREKRTFDAGATPDLDDIQSPDLREIDGEVMGQLASVQDVGDSDDAAAFHRGEDPDYDDESGGLAADDREETHLAEVYGTQELDDLDAGESTDTSDAADSTDSSDSNGTDAADASGATESDTGPSSADDDDRSASADSTASDAGTTDGSSDSDAADPTDLEDRSALVDEAADAGAKSVEAGSSSGSDIVPSGPTEPATSTTAEPPSKAASAAGSSSAAGKATKVSSRTKRSRRRSKRRNRSPEPASDPAWEAAQFVTYVEHRTVAAFWRAVSTAGKYGRAALTWVAAKTTRTPGSRERVEAVLPKVILLLLGVMVGLLFAALLT